MIFGNLLSVSSAVVGVISGVVALIIGAAVGIVVYKFVIDKKLGNAQAEAARILEDSRQEAKSMRKEALIEAKEEQHRLRTEVDREVRERRAEVQKLEQRVAAREEALTRKEVIGNPFAPFVCLMFAPFLIEMKQSPTVFSFHCPLLPGSPNIS